MEATSDAFLAISQTPDLPVSEALISEKEKNPFKFFSEKDIVIDKKYSDVKENLKSLPSLLNESPENIPFYIQKSTLCIFRFEDVLFSLYPHLAAMRRKGMTVRENFLKNDPSKDPMANLNQQSSNPPNLGNLEKHPLDLVSQKSGNPLDNSSKLPFSILLLF